MTTATVRVKAVPGRMLGDPSRKGAFLGYVECAEGRDHKVPGGKGYRIVAAGVDVPDTGYVRRAIGKGDLERVTDKAPVATKEK